MGNNSTMYLVNRYFLSRPILITITSVSSKKICSHLPIVIEGAGSLKGLSAFGRGLLIRPPPHQCLEPLLDPAHPLAPRRIRT